MPPRQPAVSHLTQRRLRLVFTCEHGGNQVPRRFARCFRGAADVLASHRAYDAGALEVARLVSQTLDAPLVYSTVSRLVVDLNRSAHHPRLFSRWTKPLPAPDRADILSTIYVPHRALVDAALARAMRSDASVLHIGVHSFTPVWDDVERPMGLGLLYDPRRAPEHRLCVDWQKALSSVAPDIVVRRNAPYRGVSDGLTRALRLRHPADRYLGVEVELNQATLRTARMRRRWAAVLVESLRLAI